VRVGHLGGLSSLSGLAWQVVMASAHLIGRVPTCRNLNTTHALSQISSLHNPHVIIPAFYLLRVFLELNLKTQYVESVLRVRSPSALCWKPCQVGFSSSCDRGVLLLTCARDNFVNTISLLFPDTNGGVFELWWGTLCAIVYLPMLFPSASLKLPHWQDF
jgi:hypothetical protein